MYMHMSSEKPLFISLVPKNTTMPLVEQFSLTSPEERIEKK